MSRLIWGTCCALLAVVLLSSSRWIPAAADGANPFAESEDAPTASSLPSQEAPRLAEIAAKRRINKVLDTRLKSPLDYIDTPLNEVISILQEDYDIPIRIDIRSLDLIAISPETEVTVMNGRTSAGTLENLPHL